MRLALFFSVLLILSGCSVTAPRSNDLESQRLWHERVAALSQITHWSLSGRIAVKIADEGWHAGLRWQQMGETYEMRIIGPLGRTLAQLSGRPGEAVLKTHTGEVFQASDPQTLLREQLGWTLPVQGLQHWVLGIPAPGGEVSALALDEQGTALHLSQSDWLLDYPDYAAFGARRMPERLRLQHDQIRIKLVVDEWDLKTP